MSAGRSRDADALKAALAAALPQLAGQAGEITALHPLSGGAIQENWALDIAWADNPAGLPGELVLRTDAASAVASSAGRAEEFAVLETVWQAGVKAPRPVLLCEDPAVIGAPFFLMARAAGTGLGNRIVKDQSLGGDRAALLQDLAVQLARIHAIHPPQPQLAHLGDPPEHPARAALAHYKAQLRRLHRASPVIAWGIARCEAQMYFGTAPVFCHRDYRTGNYMVDAHGLTAILDWEFAGWSDPDEDLGWFLSRSWRFGRPELEAGGIGDRAAFLSAYAQAAGRVPDAGRVAWWETVANIRWAIIALQQAERLAQPEETSLELALIGRRLPEIEAEILRLTRPEGAELAETLLPAPLAEPGAASTLPQPDLVGLLRLSAGSLRQEILPHLPKDAHYKALMLAAALDRAVAEAAGGEDAASADRAEIAAWLGTPDTATDPLDKQLRALTLRIERDEPLGALEARSLWHLLHRITERARFAEAQKA